MKIMLIAFTYLAPVPHEMISNLVNCFCASIIERTTSNIEAIVAIAGIKWIGSSMLLSILYKFMRATPQLKTCLKNFFKDILLLW